MLCKLTHCAGCNLADTKLHQWPGDEDCYLIAEDVVKWLALSKRLVETP